MTPCLSEPGFILIGSRVLFRVTYIDSTFFQLASEAIHHVNFPSLHSSSLFCVDKLVNVIGRDGASDDPCDQSGNGDVLGHITLESYGNNGKSQTGFLLTCALH